MGPRISIWSSPAISPGTTDLGTNSCWSPAPPARLRDQCGLANALAFDVTNACAGMLTGITWPTRS